MSEVVIKSKPHIFALDGVRGAAALLVMFYHSYDITSFKMVPLYAGGFSVSIFFALSGFLMGYLHLAQRFDAAHLVKYVTSRFSRIAPLYLLVVMGSYLVTSHVFPDFPIAVTRQNLARHLLFSGSMSILWSIPPEVQFYAFFIGIWWAVDRAAAGRYAPAIAIAVLALAQYAIAPHCPGTTLPTKIPLFLAGVVAGYLRYRQTAPLKLNDKILGILQCGALVALSAYAYTLYSSSNAPIRVAVVAGVSPALDERIYGSLPYTLLCGTTIILISQPTGIIDALFANKALRKLGSWSFALYLLHVPCFFFMQKLLGPDNITGLDAAPSWAVAVSGATLSIVASWAAHSAIERPSQKSIKSLSRRLYAKFLDRGVYDAGAQPSMTVITPMPGNPASDLARVGWVTDTIDLSPPHNEPQNDDVAEKDNVAEQITPP